MLKGIYVFQISFVMVQADCLGPSRDASPVELNSLRYPDKEKLKVFPIFKSSCINQLNSLISPVKS